MIFSAFVSSTALLKSASFAHVLRSPRCGSVIVRGCAPRRAKVVACASPSRAEYSPTPGPNRLRVGLLAVFTVVFAVCNRVAHRVQLAGVMKHYTYFISQGATLAYTVIYSLTLAARVRGGIVPGRQIRAARTAYLPVFAVIGVLEAITFSVQLYASARLPGVLIGVLGQGILPFTMVASILLLGKRYSITQVLGVMCVIAGVLTCTVPSASALALTGQNILFPASLFGCSCGVLAFAIVLKEKALRGGDAAASKHRGEQFDVFVVNSFGSAFQCLATIALLPATLALATQLPPMQYITDGLSAFLTGPYMPWLTLIYIACNIFFNIAALSLVKQASASAALIANLFSVPLVSLVFCLKLPLLTPSPFSWTICVGLAIIVMGVLLYNRQGRKAVSPRRGG